MKLEEFYSELNLTDTKSDFRNDIYQPMLIDLDTSGQGVLKKMGELKASGQSVNLKLVPMLVSCAYLAQAMRDHFKNDHSTAWFYMAEASYWCGAMMATKGIEVARNNTIIATRKNTASKGGLTRAEKYNEVKDEVFRLARELCPKQKGWQSRRDASLKILMPVLTFAKDKTPSLSPAQAPQTIYNWLKEMPDSELLFPKKSRGAKS